MFTAFCFRLETSILSKIPEILSALGWKSYIRKNLVQKIKVSTLKQNLLPTLILVC